MKLLPHQIDAVNRMHNGCILYAGVGTGKSLTALAYYHKQIGEEFTSDGEYKLLPYRSKVMDLYIITTARKRDSLEWAVECNRMDLYPDMLSTEDKPLKTYYDNHVIIDSWNNISKYSNVENAFFIFDEQRAVGSGEWSKKFIKIAKKNQWIMLSATPGDSWLDYIPVFIANGYYKNKSDFQAQHCIYSRYCTAYPKLERFINVGRLIRLRKNILVEMKMDNKVTKRNRSNIICPFDVYKYREIQQTRWNIWEDKPIENASEYCQCLRHCCNADPSRLQFVKDIVQEHRTAIVFYNFDYELEILRTLRNDGIFVAEWNGHVHQDIPALSQQPWVYLVQCNAGAEGWNCIVTDTMIFYSANYSYKMMEQAEGRIDRMNTPFMNLYYYILSSESSIDKSIKKAIEDKKEFNQIKFEKGDCVPYEQMQIL